MPGGIENGEEDGESAGATPRVQLYMDWQGEEEEDGDGDGYRDRDERQGHCEMLQWEHGDHVYEEDRFKGELEDWIGGNVYQNELQEGEVEEDSNHEIAVGVFSMVSEEQAKITEFECISQREFVRGCRSRSVAMSIDSYHGSYKGLSKLKDPRGSTPGGGVNKKVSRQRSFNTELEMVDVGGGDPHRRYSYHPGVHRLTDESVYRSCFHRFDLTENGAIRTEEELQALVLYLVYKLKVKVPVPVMEDLILETVEDLDWDATGMSLDDFISWFEDRFVVYGLGDVVSSSVSSPKPLCAAFAIGGTGGKRRPSV